MDRHSIVTRVSVDYDGQTYHADYLVEGSMILASLYGHVVHIPRGEALAADTVRTLLTARLAHRSRKLSNVNQWASSLAQGAG